MRKPFLLTPTAKEDLRDILLDLAEDSPEAANSLRERFYDGFHTLGRSPGIGHYQRGAVRRSNGRECSRHFSRGEVAS